MLRQQEVIADDKPNRCLADFVAPLESGRRDYVGAFAVTAGLGVEALVDGVRARPRRLPRDHGEGARRSARRGVRGVPARARRGATGATAPTSSSRPRTWSPRSTAASGPRSAIRRAPITPRSEAVPAARRRRALGMSLTESFAMRPAASVSGLYFANPQRPLLHGRPARRRPGRGLRAAQGRSTSRRPSGGWRRIWRTSRNR